MKIATKNKRIMILAGGTGGHVMPALAVAKQLQEQGHQIYWLGTRQGIEARIVPPSIDIAYIDIQGIRGANKVRKLLAPWRILKAIYQSIREIRRVQPQAVLSMGGYVSGPGGIAAWLMRRPLLVHEQNAYPGWTNRVLARFAKTIMVAFPGVFSDLNPLLVGNPVREEILKLAPREFRIPRRLLILGGSQGASILNEVVPQATKSLDCEILHQTGKNDMERTKQQYHALGMSATVTDFIEDMAQAYAWADVVICRAGALTVAELTAVGVASVLIPYLHAVDDHQTRNAQFITQANAGILLPQANLTPQNLQKILEALLGDPDKCFTMALNSRKLAKPLATAQVAQQCIEASCES